MSEKIIAFAGCFDGVNSEHRRVIKEAMRENGNAYRYVALIFPKECCDYIYSEREKEYALKKLGIDEVLFANFVSRADRHVDNTGLHNAEKHTTNVLLLKGEAENILNSTYPGCLIEKIIFADSEKVDNLLGDAFKAGDIKEILKLLDGEYYVIGPVVAGRGEGHRHGMPTANIKMEDGKRFLPFGVYGGTAAVCGKKDVVFGGDVATCGGNIGPGREYKALTNIGPRPSADSNPAPTVESLLVDFKEDIYGEEVVLCITDFIREIMHFEGGLDEVRLQIARDKEALFK